MVNLKTANFINKFESDFQNSFDSTDFHDFVLDNAAVNEFKDRHGYLPNQDAPKGDARAFLMVFATPEEQFRKEKAEVGKINEQIINLMRTKPKKHAQDCRNLVKRLTALACFFEDKEIESIQEELSQNAADFNKEIDKVKNRTQSHINDMKGWVNQIVTKVADAGLSLDSCSFDKWPLFFMDSAGKMIGGSGAKGEITASDISNAVCLAVPNVVIFACDSIHKEIAILVESPYHAYRAVAQNPPSLIKVARRDEGGFDSSVLDKYLAGERTKKASDLISYPESQRNWPSGGIGR